MTILLRIVLLLACAAPAFPALAQGDGAGSSASRCLAIAQSMPKAMPVAYIPIQEGLRPPDVEEVTIRFVGHSTFLITTPEGVTIATDYAGYAGPGVVPRVVTMNHAHSSHWTPNPDPHIEYVLRGWETGGKAVHRLQVGDVFIRNVTTDIRGFGGDDGIREPDGNSIFIFEVAQLCIGHLGHLHQTLGPEDLNVIGQLDIVMAPVDGSMTMSQRAMLETLQVLKARLVLPMHYFGAPTLSRFLATLGEAFDVELGRQPEIKVSVRTLPERPKVLVLPGY